MTDSVERKRLIDLSFFDGLGLIVLYPSGVFYSNQVGGLSCAHPEVEGVFVPLPTDINRYELNTLEQHFKGGFGSLDEAEINLVDTVLRRSNCNLNWISVDFSRVKDSFESWVYVKLNLEKDASKSLAGFENSCGVLTWQNSD